MSDDLQLPPEEILAEHGHPAYADHRPKTHKEQVGEIANEYWRQRAIECDPDSTQAAKDAARLKQHEIWDAMGKVPADPLPVWVKPELAQMADHFAMKDRALREDLAGSPVVCRGCWPFDDSGYGILKRLGDGWDEIEGLDTFNVLARNDALHAVASYCEGDFDLVILPDEDAYQRYLGYTTRFYGRRTR